jgi:hypothetical protein
MGKRQAMRSGMALVTRLNAMTNSYFSFAHPRLIGTNREYRPHLGRCISWNTTND